MLVLEMNEVLERGVGEGQVLLMIVRSSLTCFGTYIPLLQLQGTNAGARSTGVMVDKKQAKKRSTKSRKPDKLREHALDALDR